MISAYDIFAQTRSAIASASYPREVGYTIVVSGLDGETPRQNHYHAVLHSTDGVVRLAPISDEEKLHPPSAKGVNVTATLTIGFALGGFFTWKVPVGPPAESGDLIGVPLLSPTYDFGMAGFESRQLNVESPSETSLPVIASVVTKNRDYNITLDGTEAIDGTDEYHLTLQPVRDPKKYRLRELWVDTSTYLPRRAVVAGNFTIAPLTDVPWTIDFTTIGHGWYITNESAGATLYLQHRHVVRNANIRFSDIALLTGFGPLMTPETNETALVEP